MTETPATEVLVVGSINLDLRWSVPHLPAPGETLLAGAVDRGLGGKGANQAVAVRTLGVSTALVAAVGSDEAADWLLKQLEESGVRTAAVHRVAGSSGQAQVIVDAGSGENMIVVLAGSNALLTPAMTEEALLVNSAPFVMAQQEVPPETVAIAMRCAHRDGRFTILNAAPARALSSELLGCISLLVVNEGEALELSGSADPRAAATALRTQGARSVAVSLGAAGVVLADGDGSDPVLISAPSIADVVDTTGAGDVFTGATTAALARGRTLPDAVEIGVRAASWSVQHPGVRAPRPGDLHLSW